MRLAGAAAAASPGLSAEAGLVRLCLRPNPEKGTLARVAAGAAKASKLPFFRAPPSAAVKSSAAETRAGVGGGPRP